MILLSWDGVRHDYPERTETPGLDRMAREGSRAERLVPVFPSNTFPSHASLATGTFPDRHGIVDNVFFDPERGVFDEDGDDASWLDAEPLWSAAERQGVPTAVHFWVGAGEPWGGVAATHRVVPFDAGVDEAEKVDRILAWLDLPDGRRPRLVMGWWRGADRPGHRRGPDHPSVARALAGQDAELVRLLAGLDARDAWDHTTLLLVGDHGMAAVRERIPVRETLEAAGVRARVFPHSATAHVFLEDARDAVAAHAALNGTPHLRAYLRGSVPPRLRIAHPTRTGDLLLVTDPPYTFRESDWLTRLYAWASITMGGEIGLHGYEARHDEMGAVLYALGRGVEPGGRLGRARAVDVAPTIATLLGIAPPRHSEGRPIAGIAPPR